MSPEVNPQAKSAEKNPATRVKESYFASHPDRTLDAKLNDLFSDLEIGRFWGVLYKIDGPMPEDLVTLGIIGMPKDYKKAVDEANEWTIKNFSKEELHDVFNACMSVVLDESITRWPGNLRSQSTIHSDVIDRENSHFKEFIDEDTRKQLINGSLWEELGNAHPSNPYGYTTIQDVFESHNDVLNPGYAQTGIKLLRRNLSHNNIDISPLPDETIDKYWEFVKSLDSNQDVSKLPENSIKILVKPYVMACLDLNSYDDLRFAEYYNPDTGRLVRPKRDVKERLSDPIVLKYLSLYPGLASDLQEKAIFLIEESFHFYTKGVINEMLPDIIKID